MNFNQMDSGSVTLVADPQTNHLRQTSNKVFQDDVVYVAFVSVRALSGVCDTMGSWAGR